VLTTELSHPSLAKWNRQPGMSGNRVGCGVGEVKVVVVVIMGVMILVRWC
jgi:hypothetical protein